MTKEIKPGVYVKEVESLKVAKQIEELPVERAWECGHCGHIMLSAEQPLRCHSCLIEFLWESTRPRVVLK